MQSRMTKKISAISALALVAAMVAPFVVSNNANAANLSEASVKLDRLKAATVTGGTVCVTPTTTATEADVKVAFPTGFTVDATAANWTVTTTGLPSGATAWPGIDTATNVTGQTVTFPSTDLTVGTNYCFNFAGVLTTGTAGNDKVGTITTEASGPATIDSASYATSIVSDDQIVVNATVSPTFSFALGGNSDTFTSALSTTGTTSTSGTTATIATNADNGWVTWVKSANAGLNSASTGKSIATVGTVNDTPDTLAGQGYVLDADVTTDSATGTGTVSQAAGYGAEYNGTDTNSGGTLSTSFQPVAASDGTTDGDVLTLTERARVSAVQAAAADYTDTLTVIAAGRF